MATNPAAWLVDLGWFGPDVRTVESAVVCLACAEALLALYRSGDEIDGRRLVSVDLGVLTGPPDRTCMRCPEEA